MIEMRDSDPLRGNWRWWEIKMQLLIKIAIVALALCDAYSDRTIDGTLLCSLRKD
jgi:hypothetical protein